MIIKKSPRDIDAMAKAGELSARALRVVGAAVKPGVTTLELDRIAEETIRQGGGIPAFKGYGGFPGSICASINEQIVHGIPSDAVVLQEGDIISIDTGATVGGWVGDNAWTFPVGKISPKKQRLLEVTEESMWAGIDAARAGNHLGDIGRFRRSLRTRGMASCANMWGMGSAALCTKSRMCRITGAGIRVRCLKWAWCWRSSR